MGKVVINVLLPTETKLFCDCPIGMDEAFLQEQSEEMLAVFEDLHSMYNCPVCRGEEGAFPILNKKAVEEAVALVLALHGTVTQYTLFDRVKGENGVYDYISQYSYPIGKNGYLEWEENRMEIEVMRLKEMNGEKGIPVLEIVSGQMEEEQNTYYIEEMEKIFEVLGMEEWEIIETDDVIETMESQNPVSYLPDADIPPVIISKWWTDQVAARYPDLIHIEEVEVTEEDDF